MNERKKLLLLVLFQKVLTNDKLAMIKWNDFSYLFFFLSWMFRCYFSNSLSLIICHNSFTSIGRMNHLLEKNYIYIEKLQINNWKKWLKVFFFEEYKRFIWLANNTSSPKNKETWDKKFIFFQKNCWRNKAARWNFL